MFGLRTNGSMVQWSSLKESSGVQRRPNPKPPCQVSQVQCKMCCATCAKFATCATCQSATSGFVTCQAKSSQQAAHLQSTETWVTWHRSSVPVFLRYVQFRFFEFSKLNIYRGVFHFDGFDIKSYYVCNSSAMKSNAMICSL